LNRLYPLLATATLALAGLAHAADGGDVQLLDTFLGGVQKDAILTLGASYWSRLV
jgi:hypothetical protein